MRNPHRRRPIIPAWVGLLLLVSGVLALSGSAFLAQAGSLQQSAQEGEAIFQQKCAACHTIGGGKLVGPDLEGVTARRDMQWLAEFIARPDQMIASGDPTAEALLAENNNIPMPNLGLSEAEVQALLAYLEAGADAAPSPAGEPAAAALPQGAVASGAALFSGEQSLANGGPACIACHSVSSLGSMGGGTLGPDLTFVFRRYGAAGLSSALSTLPFPTMQGAFANRPLTAQEAADLYAYFEWANTNAPDPRPATTNFFLLGLAGTLALFAVLAFFWPRQRQRPAIALRQKSRLAARR